MPQRLNERSNRRNGHDAQASIDSGFDERPRHSDVGNCIASLNREMSRLMEEHLESLEKQAFVPPSAKQVETDEKRLSRIREVSADYLAAMAREHKTQTGSVNMTDKPHVKLPGKVEKVIKPGAGEAEKAQIAIDGADPLYREIRIENELEDGTGQKLRLKLNDEVDVTVEAEKLSTQSEKQAESNENEPTEAKASYTLVADSCRTSIFLEHPRRSPKGRDQPF